MSSGGGGGDGGAAARQAEIDRQKAEARNRLNVLFGESPAPTTRQVIGSGKGFKVPRTVTELDPALVEEAARNKAAREALYAGVRKNAYDAGLRDINEQTEDARRNLRFTLFANGLNGGSADVDENALLQRKVDRGILNLGAKADLSANDLRSADESARLGLLQSIEAGTDQTSAISSAINQMRNASERAAAQAAGTTVGNLFQDAGLLYQKNQRAQGVADARSLFPQGQSRPTAINGIVTPTY